MPVNLSQGINPYLVGGATDIVGTLDILVAIGHDPLAALLEVEEGFTDGMV